MKSLTKALVISVMILLVGFTIVSSESSPMTVPVNNAETTSVNNDENAVRTSIVNYIDKGDMIASWYGSQFHGRKTANGEVFNQLAYTAASKSLRFGTLLKVTNLRNNKSVVVRINDRGPYIGGRQLDLSKAAAQALGMVRRGVIRVSVEQLSLKGVNFPVITLN
ncbi:MAG: septal ring lytic transglycosylase RlpA family protein [Bacteroidetes bacterium]|nr:septal ring lytic transglycosylase RlpA family protein [Bacteroidota bacterium]